MKFQVGDIVSLKRAGWEKGIIIEKTNEKYTTLWIEKTRSGVNYECKDKCVDSKVWVEDYFNLISRPKNLFNKE